MNRNREIACLFLALCASSDGGGPIGDTWETAMAEYDEDYDQWRDWNTHPAIKLEAKAWRVAQAAHLGYKSVREMEESDINPPRRNSDWREMFAEAEAMLRSGWKP